MNTFIDLYNFLKNYKEKSIVNWLEIPWEGKDKQESLLRLFAGLGLIKKLNRFKIQKGNFNLGTITDSCLKDIFYDPKNRAENLKDNGDISDLTGIYKNELLVTTSKNISKMLAGKLDILGIEAYVVKEYPMYDYILCICIRSKETLDIMVDRMKKTSEMTKNIIQRDSTITIDWEDLDEAYKQFKYSYESIDVGSLITLTRKPLMLKMVQKYGVFRIIELSKKTDKILLGFISRSGKTYVIGGVIIENSKGKDECNYLIITTAPKETFEQLINVLDCCQLEDFKIILLDGKNKKPELGKKNIIICSKQFLQTKMDEITSIPWLKKMKFDFRFIDESHNGGTTSLAKKTLDYYGKDVCTVYITATYSKPVNDYKMCAQFI